MQRLTPGTLSNSQGRGCVSHPSTLESAPHTTETRQGRGAVKFFKMKKTPNKPTWTKKNDGWKEEKFQIKLSGFGWCAAVSLKRMVCLMWGWWISPDFDEFERSFEDFSLSRNFRSTEIGGIWCRLFWLARLQLKYVRTNFVNCPPAAMWMVYQCIWRDCFVYWYIYIYRLRLFLWGGSDAMFSWFARCYSVSFPVVLFVRLLLVFPVFLVLCWCLFTPSFFLT